jgi:DNA-binding transcriptional LysR family regulator
MKLSQLQIVVAVADQQNFSEATLQLGLSQSAVSHAIASLEAELGVVLFMRGRHGAQLTPVGKQIADHARQIMQLQEVILKEANLAKGLQGGQVRVATFRSVATHILPKVIAEFRQRFPAIAVMITEHDDYPEAEQALRDGYADLGFTLLPTTDEFETWELIRDEYIALFPPDFQLAGDHLTWEQLSTYPLIMPPANNSCCYRVQVHARNSHKTLNTIYEVREDSTTVNMVIQGLGGTIIPRLAAEPIPADVQVYRLPEPLFRTIGVAVLADALLSPAVFAFLDTLKQTKLPIAT